MAPLSILLIIIAAVTGDVLPGVLSIICGAIAIEEVADAAYHAGLRAEFHAKHPRRGKHE